MSYDPDAVATAIVQFLADRDIYLPASALRDAIRLALTPPPTMDTVDEARAAAQLVAGALADPAFAETPWLDPARNEQALRGLECEGLIREALQLRGGWREAIVELEDQYPEQVRLKSMHAAADQWDAWAARARIVLAKIATGRAVA